MFHVYDVSEKVHAMPIAQNKCQNLILTINVSKKG